MSTKLRGMAKQRQRGPAAPPKDPEPRESAKEKRFVQELPPDQIAPDARRRRSRGPLVQDERPLTELIAAPDKTLLTVEQARRYLNISDWFARRLIRDKTLPAIILAHNCARIELGELRALIEKNRTVKNRKEKNA